MISNHVPRFGSTDIAPLMNLTSHAAEAYRNKSHDEKLCYEILNDLQNQRPDLFTSNSLLTQAVLVKPYQPPVIHAPLRFGSLATAINANNSYREWERQKLQESKFLADAKKMQTPFYPFAYYPQNTLTKMQPITCNQVRFGVEPFSVLWFADNVSVASIDKIVGYLLKVIVSGTSSPNKKLAERYLRNANLSTERNGKLQYLKEAEKEYLRHAEKMRDDHELAATYKNLAVIAKLNGRDQRVVDDYIEEGMTHFYRWAEYIKYQGDTAVATRSGSIGSGIPVSGTAELHYDREKPKYEAEDIVDVCNKLHSRKNYTKPSIEPTESDGCIIL